MDQTFLKLDPAEHLVNTEADWLGFRVVWAVEENTRLNSALTSVVAA